MRYLKGTSANTVSYQRIFRGIALQPLLLMEVMISVCLHSLVQQFSFCFCLLFFSFFSFFFEVNDF